MDCDKFDFVQIDFEVLSGCVLAHVNIGVIYLQRGLPVRETVLSVHIDNLVN